MTPAVRSGGPLIAGDCLMITTARILTLSLLLFTGASVALADVKNISNDLPIHMEDATPNDAGQLQYQTSFRYTRNVGQENSYEIIPDLQYGISPVLQGELSVPARMGADIN